MMFKINSDCPDALTFHCLKQTESKYDGALVHSDGLTK